MTSQGFVRFILLALAAPSVACDAPPEVLGEHLVATTSAALVAPQPYIHRKTPASFLGLNNAAAQAEARRYYDAWGELIGRMSMLTTESRLQW